MIDICLVQSEYALSRLPFLVTTSFGTTALKAGYESLPLCLARQSGQAVHRGLPIKVGRSIDNHHQVIAQHIDFHFKDAHRTDAFTNLLPMVRLRMPISILRYQFRIVVDFQKLDVALRLSFR